MSTSGSINFNMTGRDLITYALRKINICAENEDPTADMAARAMTELNVMLKGWQKHENLWRLTEGSVTLLASDVDYTLSPFPHRVISARYSDTNGYTTPMEEMIRSEYYDLHNKSGTGRPNSWYVDYQRASAVMYVYQCLASASSETIQYTYQRKFEDVDALDDDIDIKQEHFEVCGYNLAARMADDYGRSGNHIDRIIARAQILLNDALDDDREDFVQFVPSRW